MLRKDDIQKKEFLQSKTYPKIRKVNSEKEKLFFSTGKKGKLTEQRKDSRMRGRGLRSTKQGCYAPAWVGAIDVEHKRAEEKGDLNELKEHLIYST